MPRITCPCVSFTLTRVVAEPALSQTQWCDTKGEKSRKLRIFIVVCLRWGLLKPVGNVGGKVS